MNEKIHYKENPYIAVKTGPKSDHYMYAERKGIDSVAFIIQTDENLFVLTEERKPPMDARIKENIPGVSYSSKDEAFVLTAFGGSNDKIPVDEYITMDQSEKIELFKTIVRAESVEEAGFEVTISDIEFIGSEFVSTQSNQICYLFLVDARNAKIVDRQPDSEMEALAQVIYCDSQIIRESIDWKSKAIMYKKGF